MKALKSHNTYSPSNLAAMTGDVVARVEIHDIHTHLYDPAIGPMLLWGLDDLLVYHYLVAETFRHTPICCEQFWALDKPRQAEAIWDALFVKHLPMSEACRGVVTTLNLLGLDVKKRDLPGLRKWFAGWKASDFAAHCLDLAGIKSVCMTNNPFDSVERPFWDEGFVRNPRFKAGLRIDSLLLDWRRARQQLQAWGYETGADFKSKTMDQVRRFLSEWSRRLDAQYLMVSLPPDFKFPDSSQCAQLIEKAVIPHCREHQLPFALMMGVTRAVNPALRMAGDGVGCADLSALRNLCASHPDVRFLVTVLARENQHELCVLARKFRNLHVFGCWWFTNVPSIVDEMTRMRLELLGASFTVQHSDARVMDQVVYKWHHTRQVVGRVLADKFADLARAGWPVTKRDIETVAARLFGGAFQEFCASPR